MDTENLIVKNLYYSYVDNLDDSNLKNISFELNKGAILGLLGNNGAGKTTLLNCIYEIYCYSGVITNPFKKMILISSELELYNNLTVYETLYFIIKVHDTKKKVNKEEIINFLELFDLSEKKHSLIKDLSYGMISKVKLIAGLIVDCDLLLLDEPMLGFDVKSIKKTREIIVEKAKKTNKTVVISSHNMSIIQDICTHLLVLDKGSVLYTGTSMKFLENYRNLETAFMEALN